MTPTIQLGDRELADLNRLLPWIMRQQDANGRYIGYGKPWPLIDGRVQMLAERFDLHGKSVLEPGCLDGHITVGLCAYGANPTAFDARMSGVAKTFLRCFAFGYRPNLLVHDARMMEQLGTFDAIMHSGVFYHLLNPVAHLRLIRDMAPVMLLDTHTARPGEPLETPYNDYEGTWYHEYGWLDQESGVDDRSFWLTKDSLYRLIDECGFDCEVIREDDHAENGPRGQYLLRKRPCK